MRIGISTSMIQRGNTGVAQYAFALVRALVPHAAQHEFTLFVLEEDRPLFDFADRAMRIITINERFRAPIRNILWHQAVLPRLSREERLDVIHVPSYRRQVWSCSCPRVTTIHDLAPFLVRGKYDPLRMFYGRVVARRLAHRQDKIIAISRNTARDIIRFFKMDPGHVTVVYNGLDHERFGVGSREDAKADVARRCGLRNPFFLYVARLEHPGKNHTRLIAAFEQFKKATGSSWQLVFGGSDWHGSDVIRAAARRSPCARDIRFLGFVPAEHLANLYRAADAFVYPSLYEGFGMPPTEAMACGCPVISSARGSLGEVVGDAAAIIDPGDVASMTAKLAALATDPALRETLRSAGLSRVRQFNWNQTAIQTLQVYEEAAAGCVSVSCRVGQVNPERIQISQPRVARNELPWVGPSINTNPERVASNRPR